MKALVWPIWMRSTNAEEGKRRYAFRLLRKLLRILWMNLLTTEQVCKMAGTESELLSK